MSNSGLFTVRLVGRAVSYSHRREQIRLRAADAYHKYQHCGVKAARTLFATGW